MSDCKIYPADTVDIYGNAWPTVGENIRNGMFGENVKVGYVNINEGIITSPDFSIIKIDSSHFRINNILCFFVSPESVTKGSLDTNFINNAGDNQKGFADISNNTPFLRIIATLKIIYKELI